MSYCTRCGAPAREGSRLCSECAAMVRRSRQQAEGRQPVRQQPRRNNYDYDAPRPRRYDEDMPRPRRYEEDAHRRRSYENEAIERRPNPPIARDRGFSEEDIQQNKGMAILSYLGLLFLIPLFAAKQSRYARFHANQGLVLCIAAAAYGVVYAVLSAVLLSISWRLYFVLTILSILSSFFVVLMVLGIVNASRGKAKPLPLIGNIRILKY